MERLGRGEIHRVDPVDCGFIIGGVPMSPSSKSSLLVAALLAGSLLAGCAEHRDRWAFHRSEDRRCAQIKDRMDLDRDKIDEIEPTGRHRDALQWYRDDLVNARRDLDRCRYGS
jgi:hypothetical protein